MQKRSCGVEGKNKGLINAAAAGRTRAPSPTAKQQNASVILSDQSPGGRNPKQKPVEAKVQRRPRRKPRATTQHSRTRVEFYM